jgi:hypothetical protein
MLIAAIVIGAVLLLALVVIAGTRMVAHPDPAAGSVGDAFGAGLAIFDPGKARADDDLASRKHQSEVVPTPDEDDQPAWRVDLHRNRVRIPRSR